MDNKKKKIYVSIVILVGVLVSGFILVTSIDAFDLFSKKTSDRKLEETPFSFSTFRDIAKRVSPAVVNITTEKIIELRRFRDPFEFFFGPNWDPFRPWLEPRKRSEKYRQKGGGSGFIIDTDGLIVTNNHVVDGMDEITVILHDNKEYDAEIVGKDRRSDIVLLKIKRFKDFKVVVLGDSDEVEVGDWVLAIGNPFGFGHTVTAGIVSAKGRELGISPDSVIGMIQTDAPINPGNSGGPLLNIYGEVIGINQSIVSGGAPQSAGLGFALPINDVKRIITQLRENGSVSRGWLGVVIQKINNELREEFNLDEDITGVAVSEVNVDSPADRAGIQVYDIITEFDGKKVKSPSQLAKLVQATPPGEKVVLTVLRDNDKLKIKVKIGELEDDNDLSKSTKTNNLGLYVDELNPRILHNFDLPDDTTGVVVTGVEPLSLAEKAGFQKYDVILEINRKEIVNLRDFKKKLKEAKNKKNTILFLVNRGGRNLFRTIKLKD